jgi:hypothetical protein
VGDLFRDNLTDESAYPSDEILRDVYSLVNNEQRENQILDYKSAPSSLKNWPETVAAFANSFGGLIIFGVAGEQDKPRLVTGFDPKGMEIKTQLGSPILSRIQPRPDFQIRVVSLDRDRTKEVALLRVSEGLQTPYMCYKDDERRVYVRSGAQKVEADLFQMRALFEKGQRHGSTTPTSCAVLQTALNVEDPRVSKASSHFYKFCVAPNNEGAARRLMPNIEGLFLGCVSKVFGGTPWRPRIDRNQNMSIFKTEGERGKLQNFGIDAQGVLGFAKLACDRTDKGLIFILEEFCVDLITFLVMASAYYETIGYYGDCQLNLTVLLPDGTHVVSPGSFRGRVRVGDLFEPRLDVIQVNFGATSQIALYPRLLQRIEGYVEELMNDFARRVSNAG